MDSEAYSSEYIEAMNISQVFEEVEKICLDLKKQKDTIRFWGRSSCSIVNLGSEDEEFIVRTSSVTYCHRKNDYGQGAILDSLDRTGFQIPTNAYLQIKDFPNFKDNPYFALIGKELRNFIQTYYTKDTVDYSNYIPMEADEVNPFVDMLIQYKIFDPHNIHALRGFYSRHNEINTGSQSSVLEAARNYIAELNRPKSISLPGSLPERKDGAKINEQDEPEVIKKYLSMDQRTIESDSLLCDLFILWYNDLSNIASSIDKISASEKESVRNRVKEILSRVQESIQKRGEGDHGRHGDWFWSTSPVPNMLQTHGLIMHRLASLSRHPLLADIFGN